MSLLNDVLRDLDSKRGAENAASPRRPGAPVAPRHRSLLLPMFALIAVLYLCLVELNLLGLFPEAIAVNLESPQPIALDSRWLARAEALKAEQAQLRMRQDRVLALPAPELDATEQARASAVPAVHQALVSQPVPTTAEASPPAVARTQPEIIEPEANSPRAVQALQSAPSTVAVSLTDRDTQFAARLLAGDWRRWQMEARTWLVEGAEYEQTALALLERYASLGAVDELKWLSEQLALRQSRLQPLVRARLDWLSRLPEDAVGGLQQLSFQGVAEQVRLRFLGGWLQQLRRHADAAEVFAALVAREGADAGDWLGLAVALDAQHRAHEALVAYRQAHRARHAEPKINTFIQQRIRELSSQTPGR